MALSDNINFIQYNENMVGSNHPLSLTDTLNRALKDFIAKFDSGNADTQVTRNHIKIASSTDIQTDVVSDDIVWFNPSSSKWEKAINSNAVGIIDVENLIVFIFGMCTLKTINNLVIGSKYYLDLSTPGGLTTNDSSSILIGTAFSANQILNVMFGRLSAISRSDRYLAAQDIANMVYDSDGNLTKIQYNEASDTDYEVLSYDSADNLTGIDHYVDSVLKGSTALTYSNGELVSSVYTSA